MKFSFKRGEKINSMTLEYPITAWVKTTRFFWVSVKPGRQAMYQLDRTEGTKSKGTKFCLVKLFGAERMPESLIVDGAKELVCDVEIVDSYNLKEYIDRHKGKKALAKPVTQVELNLNYILAMM